MIQEPENKNKDGNRQSISSNIHFFSNYREESESAVTLLLLNNSIFTSCFEPHYDNETKCTVFIMKISFHSSANKPKFHTKSFVLSLAFIMRLKATR